MTPSPTPVTSAPTRPAPATAAQAPSITPDTPADSEGSATGAAAATEENPTSSGLGVSATRVDGSSTVLHHDLTISGGAYGPIFAGGGALTLINSTLYDWHFEVYGEGQSGYSGINVALSIGGSSAISNIDGLAAGSYGFASGTAGLGLLDLTSAGGGALVLRADTTDAFIITTNESGTDNPSAVALDQAATAPAPATLALTGLGLVGLGVARRRRVSGARWPGTR